jgi:hypothetical protein
MKKAIIYLGFYMTLFTGSLRAQEEFIEAPSRLLTRISFTQLTGGVVILKALLGNFPDTLNFILEWLKLKPIATERTIRGIAGIRKVSFLFNQQLKFPGLTIDSLDFHINDYSILTAVYGEQIDGIIGFAVLNRFIVKIDYDYFTIDFLSKGTIRYPRGGYLLKPSINMLAAQTLRVRDDATVTSRFLYDMGAGVCMLLTRDFVNDSSLISKKRKRWIKEGEGLGGKIDMELTVIKEVKLGPYRFKNVPVYVFEDEYNVTSYPYLGGLIGNDILRRFNVILNYDKRDIYLMPNSHYGEPFDYSYSGVELYLVNGVIVVGDVAKGSPAEQSGLQEGDEVIGINKNFSQNLNQYKITLQNPSEKVKFIIRRDKMLKEIEFRIKSIM